MRVLIGKNASVPTGHHNTDIGYVRVRSYYGGLIIGLSDCDLYWRANKYDGWGAGPGQRKFVPPEEVPI